jgi:UDP:flavonoid glycosyltransferase YjiC (YdhE family)
LGFPVYPIRSIKSNVFHDRLASGEPLYTTADLRQYVQEDLRVMTEWEPDLVIGDFRLSLSVSARLAGVPYVTVTNAYWSPFARPHFLVPELPITERLGLNLAQGVFNLIRPVVFAQHAYALNKVRREYGLPAVRYDLPHIFSDADYTLYADLPQLVPTVNLPSQHRYIGPVVWSFETRPPWWTLLRENVPTVYVTMGTSGRADVAQMVARALACMGWQVLMATADDRTIAYVKDGMYVANYLPGMSAARMADLVVCNGGSGTVYQALAAGKPVLGIPRNLDQYLMMDYIRRFGAGEMIRAGLATGELVARTVRRMVESGQYSTRAIHMRDEIGHYRTRERFQTFIECFLQDAKAALTVVPRKDREEL